LADDGDSLAAPVRKMKILVIDDEPDTAESIRSALQELYDVSISTDPSKVLDEFRQTGKIGFDLVLVDYKMPHITGFTLYNGIKQIDADAKVCIMTAYEIFSSNTKKAKFEALDPPLNEKCIMQKPFLKKDLIAKLHQILNDSNK